MQTMYKVVGNTVWGIKTSCTITNGTPCIFYSIGKWTAKRKYGPMVFQNKDRAKTFMMANFPTSFILGYYEIWECDAQDVRECYHVLPVDDVLGLSSYTVRRHMTAVQEVFDGSWCAQWAPIGTFVTSRIRLTRKVW